MDVFEQILIFQNVNFGHPADRQPKILNVGYVSLNEISICVSNGRESGH